tara:strand:+ start:276 stop:542 length:267 start_codon:yes stop_codon:yes gene_type:complete
MNKEKITIINNNINFIELPIKEQNALIDGQANDMLQVYDEGVYTKKTALLDAKTYYTVWNKDKKYVYYHSSWHGYCSDEVDRFNDIED